MGPNPNSRHLRFVVAALLLASWMVAAKPAPESQTNDAAVDLRRRVPLADRGPIDPAVAAASRALTLGPDAQVPPNLGPDEVYVGKPWRGADGITERVSDIMARETATAGASVAAAARAVSSPHAVSDGGE